MVLEKLGECDTYHSVDLTSSLLPTAVSKTWGFLNLNQQYLWRPIHHSIGWRLL